MGEAIDRHCDVTVYQNGPLKDHSHGKHYSPEGYYYGQKWQCVEFIKRYYDQALDHKMPHVWGHARDFFDPAVSHGTINPRRGLVQFRNGEESPAQIDDILIFSDTTYGHLAIVSAVGDRRLEVVQQNILGFPRQTFYFSSDNQCYTITGPRAPDGWLRLINKTSREVPL